MRLTMWIYFISDYIKALERRMSQPGWIYVKVTLKMAQLNVQNSCEYPVKALCLNEMTTCLMDWIVRTSMLL